MTTSTTEQPSTRLSTNDRILLFVEQEGNKRLRSLGTLLYRLTRGRFTPQNLDVVLLTTIGRKSGRPHTVLLQSFPDGADMIIVAANSGRASHPDWFYNLKATSRAHVEIMDRSFDVHAEELPPEQAEALWPRILRRAPTYVRYQKATSRAIPLVRLVPFESGEGETHAKRNKHRRFGVWHPGRIGGTRTRDR